MGKVCWKGMDVIMVSIKETVLPMLLKEPHVLHGQEGIRMTCHRTAPLQVSLSGVQMLCVLDKINSI